MTTKVGSSVFIDAPVEKVFNRIAEHDICNDWLEFISSARYTSKEKTGVGVSPHHSGQVMSRKNGMGRKSHRMDGKRFYRLAGDLRHTPGNEDESRESCREGGEGHTLLLRSGVYA